MKRLVLPVTWAAFLAVGLVTGYGQTSQPPTVSDWENVQLLGSGKEAPHASMIACPDVATAKAIRWVANDERVKSPWYISLNGSWKFHYGPTRHDRVPEFFRADFDDRSWSAIKVPGTMEMQGYGVPIYVNIPYPWMAPNPPLIPDDNPNNTLGSYRRKFTLPRSWTGRPVFITFDCVYSFFYLWVNGQKVGLSKDSRSPAEFEITRNVHTGENVLAVEVHRWTDASYLEDQDTWRLSGIYRDVYLWSPPLARVRDLEVQTELDASFQTAELTIKAQVHNFGSESRSVAAEVTLLAPSGAAVSSASAPKVLLDPGQSAPVELHQTINHAALWSAEIPNRYLALITLKDVGGKIIEVIPSRVGFRKVQIVDGQLRVNGRVILIKGVDRHEQDLEHDFSVTPDSERADIELMKRFNINAVRTCHYPNQPSWYDLCDEYGIYLAAECNIETHQARDIRKNPTTMPEWGPAYLDRAQRNVETHKNHPSIILWSLGNEAGNGINMEANYRWIKQRDPSRPVFYDDAGHAFNTDLITSMYIKPWDVAKYSHQPHTRPMVLCEYAYARGNASGDLWSYWKTFYERQHAQGGFIWDFQDRGLPQPQDPQRNGAVKPIKPGDKTFWAYGGDFGPAGTPSDGNQVCNGIFGADRKPHPGAWEVKHVYQYVHCKPVDLAARLIEVKNEWDFLNLQDVVTGDWRLMEEGKAVQHGALAELDLPAGKSAQVRVPIQPFTPKPGREYWLDVSLKLKRDLPRARAGHEVAWDQFKLPDAAAMDAPDAGRMPALAVDQQADRVIVAGRDFKAAFSRTSGALVSLICRGMELVHSPLQPHFWRAPVDNDIGYGFDKVHAPWKTALDECKVEAFEVVDQSPKKVHIQVRLGLPKVNAAWEADYMVDGWGDVAVDCQFKPSRSDLPTLPRLGMQMGVAPGFERLRWYGCGPCETYSDRKDARISVYSGTVDEQVVDYTRPSEMGNKVEVRWLALTNTKGVGLLAVGCPTLSACALHYTTADLEGKRHLWEVPRRDFVTLNLDYRQMGIGGDDGWGARPHNEFQIRCEPARYRFCLRALTSEDRDVATVARLVRRMISQ